MAIGKWEWRKSQRRLEDVLRILEAAGLKLKAAKYQLMKTSVTYLGHVVIAE